MISNTVIVLLVFIVTAYFRGIDGLSFFIVTGISLLVAVLFDWFNICMTLNKDKRESE